VIRTRKACGAGVRRVYALLAGVALALLEACGHSASSAHTQSGAQAGHLNVTPKGGEGADTDMVAAVSAGGSSTPISMKFLLSSRPVVGTPLQVVVALIPAANVAITHIHASFQPGEGLQLQSDRSVDINEPAAGTMLEQQVTVLPQQAGVLNLSVTVVVDMDAGSLARTYSIPLIASDHPS
jgi:hypothetical protein